jgi:hypothetical protein
MINFISPIEATIPVKKKRRDPTLTYVCYVSLSLSKTKFLRPKIPLPTQDDASSPEATLNHPNLAKIARCYP